MSTQNTSATGPALTADKPATLPHHRFLTSAEAAAAHAVYTQRWQEWLASHSEPADQTGAYYVHQGIWQGAHGAETISVRDSTP